MQTFLPYPDFLDSAKVLDRQRLGKQRIEAWQIYQALINPEYGWQNHPAVSMWRGFEKALLIYGINVCYEWTERGYKDSLLEKFRHELDTKYDGRIIYPGCIPYPEWLGNQKFHDSHKSNLIRKFSKHYQPLWPEMNGDLPYWWPIKKKG